MTEWVAFIIFFKNDFIITKQFFINRMKKDFDVHMCIDCWGDDCHLPCFFKWHVTLISWTTWEIYLFSSRNYLYLFHLNGTIQKFHHHRRFLILHWISLSCICPHAMIVSFIHFNLIFFCFVLVLDFAWFYSM